MPLGGGPMGTPGPLGFVGGLFFSAVLGSLGQVRGRADQRQPNRRSARKGARFTAAAGSWGSTSGRMQPILSAALLGLIVSMRIARALGLGDSSALAIRLGRYSRWFSYSRRG